VLENNGYAKPTRATSDINAPSALFLSLLKAVLSLSHWVLRLSWHANGWNRLPDGAMAVGLKFYLSRGLSCEFTI
jgi:hypothetical protein